MSPRSSRPFRANARFGFCPWVPFRFTPGYQPSSLRDAGTALPCRISRGEMATILHREIPTGCTETPAGTTG